jgi:FkbM family methyltransferase
MKNNILTADDWFKNNCYETIWIDHPLTEDSVVIEFGGYKGTWVKKIFEKYNCNIFVYEPVPSFYQELLNKFNNNQKVKIFNYGVSVKNESKPLFLKHDSTSVFFEVSDECINANFMSIDEILSLSGEVSLCQINIEGYEYELLEYLIETNKIQKLERIIIEFHGEKIEDCIERRKKIQDNLSRVGYEKVWDYEWFFEYWIKNKKEK